MSKTIVLFADGTGNGAASAFKTNVWRMYMALDVGDPAPGEARQIAFYDDGVGTASFKPLAMLGGAFGFGLMNNVKDLYAALCRTYSPGDRIFAFGFSRGAFTIRLLVGLIARCGLVEIGTGDRAIAEQEFRARVDAAFLAYRRDFLWRAADARWMFVYTGLMRVGLLFKPELKDEKVVLNFGVHRPSIEFLGLWDTVDAYGMPVEEIKRGIDQWVWPMSLADRKLSPIVKRACHALSVDDERTTFRPVLWTEKGEASNRIQQVWFPGVHANVGGGYPVDGLAFVSLHWMMERAAEAKLRLLEDHRVQVSRCADAQAKIYDSRSGLAGYYRYGPRNIGELCKDQYYVIKNRLFWRRDDGAHDVDIEEPLVHQSVLDRISRRQVPYAPVSLPARFTVVPQDPPYDPGRSQVTPERQPAPKRIGDLHHAWCAVWRRRASYFATVLTTAILLLVGCAATLPPWPTEGWRSPALDALSDSVSVLAAEAARLPGLDTALGWLPGTPAQELTIAGLGIVLIHLFFFRSRALRQLIDDRAEYALRDHKDAATIPAPRTELIDHLAGFARTSKLITGFYRLLARELIPNIIGVALLLTLGPIMIICMLLEDLMRPSAPVQGRSDDVLPPAHTAS